MLPNRQPQGVFGACKTHCIALISLWFAARGRHIFYASRENTTVRTMANAVHALVKDFLFHPPLAVRMAAAGESQSDNTTLLSLDLASSCERTSHSTGTPAKKRERST